MPARRIKDRHSATQAATAVKESQIQKAFVEEFDLRAGRDAFLFSVPVERNSSPANMAHLKKMGLRPGTPDLFVIWRGGGVALEMKAPKGRLSKNQLVVHAHLSRLSWPVEVVRSVDEAWAALAKHGCPVRGLLVGASAGGLT